MDNQKMFCFQCQETAKGTGCTVKGVCGKLPQTSMYMDVLLASVRAVGYMADIVLSRTVGVKANADCNCNMDNRRKAEEENSCCHNHEEGDECNLKYIGEFITDALFATITNANFDDESIKKRICRGLQLRDDMVKKAKEYGVALPNCPELHFCCKSDGCNVDVCKLGVLRYKCEDQRSLCELTMYGLKGIAAYYEHAMRLGYEDREIITFMCHALSMLTLRNADISELTNLVLETGNMGVRVMALLDKANTSTYGNPEITNVNIGVGKRPGILVSGHDLHDIADLLQQTEQAGVDVYTHSEMLPAHYYPKLKQYRHLIANYGNAWWKQTEEFEHFHGPIVFSTNCLVPPRPGCSYADRVFTLNSTGYHGWKHIPTDANGHKDFSEVIALAKTCAPPDEIETGQITGGFAHAQMVALADMIVDAVKQGKIKRFVVMSGCDGRMKSREYYTKFAQSLPEDNVILTSGCAKYRYIKLPLGDIDGIPRVLDAGQCNDSYSWVMVALHLKEIFKAASINDLPIVFNIAWYEQKAVIVLLALLSLGIHNIHIGPTLPAFLSPNVLKMLQDKFGVAGPID